MSGSVYLLKGLMMSRIQITINVNTTRSGTVVDEKDLLEMLNTHFAERVAYYNPKIALTSPIPEVNCRSFVSIAKDIGYFSADQFRLWAAWPNTKYFMYEGMLHYWNTDFYEWMDSL